MCVNKDLLDKEGIEVPKEGWSLEEFYTICKKLTKDTNGDGQLDQLGVQNTPGKKLWAANGGSLFQGGDAQTYGSRSQRIFDFFTKIGRAE